MVDVDHRMAGLAPAAHAAGLRRLSTRAAASASASPRHGLHSFHAVAAGVLAHLRAAGVAVHTGLNDAELARARRLSSGLRSRPTFAPSSPSACPQAPGSRTDGSARASALRSTSPPPRRRCRPRGARCGRGAGGGGPPTRTAPCASRAPPSAARRRSCRSSTAATCPAAPASPGTRSSSSPTTACSAAASTCSTSSPTSRRSSR